MLGFQLKKSAFNTCAHELATSHQIINPCIDGVNEASSRHNQAGESHLTSSVSSSSSLPWHAGACIYLFILPYLFPFLPLFVLLSKHRLHPLMPMWYFLLSNWYIFIHSFCTLRFYFVLQIKPSFSPLFFLSSLLPLLSSFLSSMVLTSLSSSGTKTRPQQTRE